MHLLMQILVGLLLWQPFTIAAHYHQKIVRKSSGTKILVYIGTKEPQLLEKFGGKIKILNAHNLLCQKFANARKNSAKNLHSLSVQKLQLPTLPTF